MCGAVTQWVSTIYSPDTLAYTLPQKRHTPDLSFELILKSKMEKNNLVYIWKESKMANKYITVGIGGSKKQRFFFFFFLIWVLRPFQEYFTYIEPIVHRRWAKTGEPGEKPPDHP